MGKPPLDAMINIFDFEAIAQREMLSSGKKEGWCYYSSGGGSEGSNGVAGAGVASSKWTGGKVFTRSSSVSPVAVSGGLQIS